MHSADMLSQDVYLYDCLHVCPSVRHTPVFYLNG